MFLSGACRVLGAGLVFGLGLAVAEAEETRSYAIIVAHNQSFDGDLRPLKYADDDGARFAELLGLAAEETTLLSVLDPETQSTFPGLAAKARPPTRDALDVALASTFERIRRDTEAGLRTVFYFIFIGHGSRSDAGEGYVHLLDGRFTRSDLFQKVVSKSPATINHVVIDACHAYFMVARRGSDEDRATAAAMEAFVAKEDLARYPNTGFLVSTSKAQEVHEWSRFEAGVFSHEVRSALAGGADVDGDGKVTYEEVRAFVAAANASVRDEKAKLSIYATAPRLHLAEPLFDRGRAQDAPTLLIPAELSARYYLEDERGVRYADLHMSRDTEVTLVLVPVPTYFLRTESEESRISLTTLRHADASLLSRTPSSVASRGAEHLTFQRDLFAVPFGRAYFEGFRASRRDVEAQGTLRADAPSPALRVAAFGTAGLAVAAAAVGVGFGVSSGSYAARYRDSLGTPEELTGFRETSEDHATAANVLFASGAGLALSSLVLFLLSEDVL